MRRAPVALRQQREVVGKADLAQRRDRRRVEFAVVQAGERRRVVGQFRQSIGSLVHRESHYQ